MPPDLMGSALMVAQAQSRQQRKHFLANAALYSSMQVGSGILSVHICSSTPFSNIGTSGTIPLSHANPTYSFASRVTIMVLSDGRVL